jgi:hypothetical protein
MKAPRPSAHFDLTQYSTLPKTWAGCMSGGPMRVLLAIVFGLIATAANAGSCQFIANRIYCDNGLSGQRLGSFTYWTTASHRGTPEILYTIATAQAHNGSAITPTTMTGRHRTRMAILPILVTAPGASGSLIKCSATELVDYSGGTEAPLPMAPWPLVSPGIAG